MGVAHENEYSAERGLFSLDIVLDPVNKVLDCLQQLGVHNFSS